MHADTLLLQAPTPTHTLSASRQTLPAALVQGWLWAFPPLLVIICALAAKLGVALTPLTFFPPSSGSHYLVTTNLDILLTATLLDGILGLVWLSRTSASDNTSVLHLIPMSVGIGVLGMVLLGFISIRSVSTLQSQLDRKQRVKVIGKGYKPWGMVVITRNWKVKAFCRPVLLSLPPRSYGAVFAEQLRRQYLDDYNAMQSQQAPVPNNSESEAVPGPDPTPERDLQAEVNLLQQQLSQTIADSQVKMRELNDTLGSKDLLAEQLRAEIQARGQAGQDIERLQAELAARNAEIIQLRSQIDDLVNSTRVEVQQLRSERVQRDKELSELQRQKASLETRVTEQSQLLENAMKGRIRIERVYIGDRQALEAARLSIADLEERSTRQTKTLENIGRENAQLKETQDESRSEIQRLQEQLQKSLAENEALRAQLLLQGQVQDAQEGISSHLPPHEDSAVEANVSSLSFAGAVLSVQSLDSIDVGNGTFILQPLASRSATSLSYMGSTEDNLAAHLPPLEDESTIMPIRAADVANLPAAQAGSQEHASEASSDVLSDISQAQNLYGSDDPPNKREPPEEPQVLTWEEKQLKVLERLECEQGIIDRFKVQHAEKRDEVSPYISRMLNLAAGLPARSAAYSGPTLEIWLRGLSANSTVVSMCDSGCSPDKREWPEEQRGQTWDERVTSALQRLEYEQGIIDRYRAEKCDERASSTLESEDEILAHVPLLVDDDDDDASLFSSDSIQFGPIPDWLQGRLMDVSLEPLSAVSSTGSLSGEGNDFLGNRRLASQAQKGGAAPISPVDSATMCSSESSLNINFDGVANEFMESLLATSLSDLWAVSPDF